MRSFREKIVNNLLKNMEKKSIEFIVFYLPNCLAAIRDSRNSITILGNFD